MPEGTDRVYTVLIMHITQAAMVVVVDRLMFNGARNTN